MSDFAELLARPARLEPATEAEPPIGSLIEVDAATLGKVVELAHRMGLPPALVVKVALRALEVELRRAK